MHATLRTLTTTAAIGSGVTAGVFFAFSTFVMRALHRLPDRQGMAAMQSINVTAPNPPFMAALFGTALLGTGLGVWSALHLDEDAAPWVLAGSALAIATAAVTVVYHVPRNDALARIDPGGAGAIDAWRAYAPGWTAWNHVRTLTSLASAVAWTVAVGIG